MLWVFSACRGMLVLTHTHTRWCLTAVCECGVHLCVCHLSAPDRFIVEGGSAPRILLRGLFSLLKDSIIVSEDVSELHSCTHFHAGVECMRTHTCHINLNNNQKKHSEVALRKMNCNRYPANGGSYYMRACTCKRGRRAQLKGWPRLSNCAWKCCGQNKSFPFSLQSPRWGGKPQPQLHHHRALLAQDHNPLICTDTQTHAHCSRSEPPLKMGSVYLHKYLPFPHSPQLTPLS